MPNSVVQHSLWEPEPVEQATKYYTWGDKVEQVTRYVGGDEYNIPERLQKLADIISREKYYSVEMRDAAGKRVPALITIEGACVEENYVRYRGTLTEPCTIYGAKSRYGNMSDEDEEELNDYE